MPLFQYTALEANGKKIAGFIDADSLEVAKERLRRQKVFVTKLAYKAQIGKEAVLSKKSLLQFTRDIALLLKAGLPLYETLMTIEEKYRNHKHHRIFLDLGDMVKQGKSLSNALARYSQTFDPIYISMVKAGEQTASLPHVFMQLTKIISRSEKLKRQIHTAMVYPIFLGTFCLVVLIALFLFLIPSMKELLEGRVLHPLTQSVLAISNWMTTYGPIIFSLLAIAGAVFILFIRGSQGKKWIKKTLLHISICRRLITQAVLVRFSRALSVLMQSGVPVVDALKLAADVTKHPSFEEVIKSTADRLIEGKKLSKEMGKSHLIPSMVVRMLATAEETGTIPEMLLSIASIYEDDLEKSLSQLMNLLQPVLLVVLGLIVGIVLLSVLLPLTDVNAFLV